MKHDALIGRTIAGKYLIESLVGQGAMGCVYKARQMTLGTTLALKVLHRQLAGEPMFAARFLREAQAASRVDHPSSMRVADFGEEPDGLLYIAMEYVDGKTLAHIIEQEGPLPVARIVDIACQALAALAVAHDIGVIHRDLKPENIMVIEGQDDEGRTHDIVKVCDFGVAKLLEGGARAPSVTAQGVVVGTPEYMSPEQARGESLDARSDIYAMGVLLFQLMTGKVPFDSSTAFGTALMQVNDEPTRPRLLNPRVDARLERICLKAMRKRPGERYASARELRGELRALLAEDDAYADDAMAGDAGPGGVRHDSHASGGLLQQIEAKPRRSGLVVAGVVLAASVVAGVILYPHRGATPGPRDPVQTATVASALVPAAAKPAGAPAPVDGALATAPAPAPAAPAVEPAPSVADEAAPSAVRGMRPHAKASARHGKGKLAPGAGAPAAGLPIGAEEIPALPDPNARDAGDKTKRAKSPPAATDKPATDKPATDKPATDKPATDKLATDKPATDKPAPSKPAKPDPADAPLPVFPIPPPDAP